MNLEFLIDLSLYMILGLGSIFLMWGDIELIIGRFKLRHRLRALKIEQKKLPQPLEYISKLIDVSFGKESSKRLFVISEGLLFLVSYLLSYKNFNSVFAIPVSLLSITLPVLVLASKLEASRAKASHEGISLVSELYRQYRINNFNMYEAIAKSVEAEGDYKLSSKRLYSLLLRLRSSCGIIEARNAIDNFVFSYGTSWAKMLGQCIKLSIEDGTDVSAGLADIANQLKEANTLEEKRKLLNGEASRMTILLIPIMYILCMAIAIFYLGLKPKNLFVNQFLNPKGFLIFILNVFLFLTNSLLLAFANSGKLDY